jgi:hypothetical protein
MSGKSGISEIEQRKLRNKAKSKLLNMESILNKRDAVQVVDEFKNRFNVCEGVYKTILLSHQKYKGKEVQPDNLKLLMTQIPYALEFAGYDFNKNLLNELFGSKSKHGKTAKKLRDSVSHDLQEKDINEIINRKDELFGYMDSFLDKIRGFDRKTNAKKKDMLDKM